MKTADTELEGRIDILIRYSNGLNEDRMVVSGGARGPRTKAWRH
jgi:hypothetical protein